MKHVKLFESFLGSEWIYEAESSTTGDDYDHGSAKNKPLLVKLINKLQGKILPTINEKIKKAVPASVPLKLGGFGTLDAAMTLKATSLKVNTITVTSAKNSPSGMAIANATGQAGFSLDVTLPKGDILDTSVSIKVPFVANFSQKIEFDKLKLAKIYPPKVGLYTLPSAGAIEEIGYIYLNNNELTYAPDYEKTGIATNPEKAVDPVPLAKLKVQNEVDFAFDPRVKGAPLVYNITDEDRQSLVG